MIHFRFANEKDAELYFLWLNDPAVRENSYQTGSVSLQNHLAWFSKNINNPKYFFYLFLNEKDEPVGQVRVEKGDEESIIGISIDQNHRGKGIGVTMLRQACEDFLKKFPEGKIIAYIKSENEVSRRIFNQAGFTNETKVMVHGTESYRTVKANKHGN